MSTPAPVRQAKKPKQKRKQPVIPRTRKPEGMSLEDWQIALRRQFGRQQKFRLANLGTDKIFSEFNVTNPETKRTYRVSVRGGRPGDNFCTCPDFAINTLGTCKHIEFALAKLERQRGAKALLKAGYCPAFSEVYLRYGAQREVAFRPAAQCPPAVRALVERYFDPTNILKQDAYGSFESFLQAVQETGHELRCYEDAIGFVAQVRDRAALAQRVDDLFPQGIRSPAFDDLVTVSLYDYQRAGALFAAKAGRCLLADDMGLGKTIQSIAAVEILARAGGVERVLIVAPTSLKHQWQQEIARFSGRSAMVIEGMSVAREAKYALDSFYKITNYEVVHRDMDIIRRWEPDLVILDEAQRIKNWKTRAAQTVKRLPSQHAIVLTGTPLENRLEELHSIVEFVDRFRLGPSFRFLHEHQILDPDGRVVGYCNLSQISQTLKPILIRRTKAEVLKELPERLEKHLIVPMTPQQRVHHDDNKEIVARIVAKWRRYHFLTEADQRRMRVALQYMRMSCNSTYLIDQKTDYGVKANEFKSLLSEMLEQPEMKVVVFSQWVRTHELLAARLQELRCGHVLFHGGVPGPKRKDLIARFKEEDKCRVFLSTDAGGVGLNLQNASAVINMDQPWNPAVLEQRIGRVHRLGQHRPVHVMHFVSENTIEHSMLNLLKFKRSLFAGVLDRGEDEVFMGGNRLKKFMETVEEATTNVPPPVAAVSVPQIEEEQERPRRPKPADGEGKSAPPAPAAPPPVGLDNRVLSDLITAGKQFLDGLAAGLTGGDASTGAVAARRPALIERDEKTGQSYLKLPMPSGDMIGRLAALLGALTGRGS